VTAPRRVEASTRPPAPPSSARSPASTGSNTRAPASDRSKTRFAPDRSKTRSAPDRANTGTAAHRRRRLLALGLLLVPLAVGLVVGGHLVLMHAARFRVGQIEVTGASSVDPALIRAVSGVEIGEPLLGVRTDEVRQRVAAIPALAAVWVSRRWPSTLAVGVTERTPVALAASAAGPMLVDATGQAYQAAPTPAPKLPRLAADRVAPDDPATRSGLAVLAALPAQVRDELQVVTAGGPDDVNLMLAKGKQVRWGSPDRAPRKAAVLAALLTQPGTIYDVTAPDLPTIRR
jgi:cell division protein FtsQ